ncbi:trigger factor [Nonlabens ulvanivorans]|uniref:Cell division trigger factor n=2 Tax=Nonlabens ulvanivorans TaxID=906888 RepID=A0A090Q844_NONUL|nr:trigger factor [Nonlabens ulvanivorans]GAK98362.1 cell division trigger factor [Nonlabens ulvanivorans]GAL73671.1 cell division trigger factor [Nonlabens ulvanivorans]
MNIKRTDIDALNALLTLTVEKADYQEQVDKLLADYRKTANIPGFRKGHVPASLIRKKYRTPILVEEINKMIQQQLNEYITKEELELLGNPLPKAQEDINWDADDFTFEFELGIAPQFDVDVKGKKTITHYDIKTDDDTLNRQIDRIREQYGKLIAKDTVAEGNEVTGVFRNDDEDINSDATFKTDKIKGKTNLKKFVGSKVGDTLELKTKSLFEDDHDLMNFLKVEHDKAHGLDIKVTFEITEVNERELAEMNQEFFDKLFGPGVISSKEELMERLREDAGRQFSQQTDQKLLTDVTEGLIENTKFDLPADFLKRWIANSGENPMTEEEAAAEYERSEKGLRYQLIESKILKTNPDLQLKFEELKDYSRTQIKAQMAQYGHTDASDEEIDGVVARIMQNQEEVKRMSEQLQNEKMLQFFKDNAKLKKKELTYEEFIKEAYES